MKSSHFLVFLRHRYTSIDEYIVVNMDINIIKKLHQTIHVHVCTNGTKTMSTYYQKKNPLSIERENTGKKYRTFHLQNMFF